MALHCIFSWRASLSHIVNFMLRLYNIGIAKQFDQSYALDMKFDGVWWNWAD